MSYETFFHSELARAYFLDTIINEKWTGEYGVIRGPGLVSPYYSPVVFIYQRGRAYVGTWAPWPKRFYPFRTLKVEKFHKLYTIQNEWPDKLIKPTPCERCREWAEYFGRCYHCDVESCYR